LLLKLIREELSYYYSSDNEHQRKGKMVRIIRSYPDGTVIYYDQGRFDRWGVHITKTGGVSYRPIDAEYFLQLSNLSKIHGVDKIYGDFVQLYDVTRKDIDDDALKLIDQISNYYGIDEFEVNKTFTILYAAMVSEENKKDTKLGKRIKRLGVFQMLIENYTIEEATQFSMGKKAEYLAQLCRERGF